MLKGTVGNKALFDFLSETREGKISGVFSSGIYIEFGTKIILLHDELGGVLPFGIFLPEFK